MKIEKSEGLPSLAADDDSLLSDENLTASDSSEWRNLQYTAKLRTAVQKRYLGAIRDLVRNASASTDPKVATQGARITEMQIQITMMGGKVL